MHKDVLFWYCYTHYYNSDLKGCEHKDGIKLVYIITQKIIFDTFAGETRVESHRNGQAVHTEGKRT